MNLRDLQYIIAVAELKSFSKAADKCFVSQPTLSGQIKKFEEQLDITLFERTNKKVYVTDIGAAIVESARAIIKEMEHIKEIAHISHDPLSGTFTLGAFPTLAPYLFPRFMNECYDDTLSKVRFVFLEEKTDTLIEQLHAGTLDAAFLALPIDDKQFHVEPLFDDPFFLAIPETTNRSSALTSFLKRVSHKPKTVSDELLSHYDLMLLEEGHCLRDQALDVCKLRHIPNKQDFRGTSLETLKQMVKSGTGMTLVPHIAIHEPDPGICYIPFDSDHYKRTIGLVWRTSSLKTDIIEHILKSTKKYFL